MLFAASIVWGRGTAGRGLWVWLAYALCLAMSILSGRRALWLVLVATPFITAAFISLRCRTRRCVSIVLVRYFAIILVSVVVFVALITLFDLSLHRMFSYLVTGLPSGNVGAGTDLSASQRYLQAIALLRGWLESPWLGQGHGAVASIIRSQDMPWAYELQYLALLFHTGVAGAFIYAGSIIWVYLQGVRLIYESRSYAPIMLPLLVGLTSFLIANATNPYLPKFDSMWTIFLPLAVINRWLIEGSERSKH